MPVLTESSQRPTCMPGAKDECFLPRISQRGSSSDSESLVDYRRGIPRIPSSAATSTSSSPVKLPAINGKSKSNSVSSLSNGTSPIRGREEQRSNLCRSPSCPSNLGFWYERDGDIETPTPVDNNASYPPTKRESCDFRLPDIKDRNSMCSGASLGTMRSLSTQRSPTRNGVTHDLSPTPTRRDPSVALAINRDVQKEVHTPRAEQALDSQRSTNQSALLLPIRNSESRLSLKKKKKKKKQGSRQNTEDSIKSENSVVNDANAKPLENIEKVKSKMDTIESRGYFSEAEGDGMSDDRCISRVTEENVLSKAKDNVVSVNKRHKLKKRVTDSNMYFERELTQVNA